MSDDARSIAPELPTNRTNNQGYRLSVVTPCYNEAGNLVEFHRQLRTVLDALAHCVAEIIFIDDGSHDDTPQVLESLAAQDSCIRVISLSRNFGQQVALTAGLDAADGDAVVMLDSDLQHPPSLIPEMIARWQAGADIVSPIRDSTSGISLWKRASSAGFYKLINFFSDTQIIPGAADFCLLSRRAHQALLQVRERQRFLRGMVSWIGFNRTFIRFDAPARVAGKSSYGFGRMVRLAIAAIVSFSSAPLRMATRIGFATSTLGLVYLVYILFAWLFLEGVVTGWTSTISIILIMGGVQLMATGVLGEYLAVVYDEVKQRPLYIAKSGADGVLSGRERRTDNVASLPPHTPGS